jgi:hypothetical protein
VKFTQPSRFTDPDAATRKLVEIANVAGVVWAPAIRFIAPLGKIETALSPAPFLVH